MHESGPNKTVSVKVAEVLKKIKEANHSSGDLALKLNTLLTTRELEGSGKDIGDIAKKTKQEMEEQYGNLSDAEISELKAELELLHHAKKRNYI